MKYSDNSDIIIIDNDSSDNSVKYVKESFPQIEVKSNPINYGFAKGYNEILLKENRYDIFALINNDVEVTPNWIDPLKKELNNQNTGIVQPKILNYTQKNKFDYAGAAGGFLDLLGFPFCRGRIIDHIELDKGQYNNNTQIFWASGACFMINSSLYRELNGFDEDLFMHQEEIDLCWRTHGKNKSIYYCHNSVVYHYGGGTLKYNHSKKTFYNHRNNLLILIKNMEFKKIISVFPIRIFIDYIIITLYTLQFFTSILSLQFQKNKILNAIAIIKSHISFLYLFPKFILKRKQIKTKLDNRIIILSYFLKKKRTYTN